MAYIGTKPADKPLTSADITDGIITNADIASGAAIAQSKISGSFGKVLQVVTATDSTQRGTTSTTYVTASNTLSVSITPSSTSNKIFILVSTSFGLPGGADGIATIFRGSTNLEAGTNNGFARVSASVGVPVIMSYLDSPSTTSATTYEVRIRETAAVANLSINWNNTLSSITLFEIAG